MTKPESAKPTPEEITAAAQTVMNSFDLETGRHPEEIFYATSATVPRETIELAILSLDKREILLTERPSDDPHFTSMWHLPGVMLVTADHTHPKYSRDPHDNAACRALEELEGTRVTSLLRLSPKWISQTPREGPRGIEIPIIYVGLLVDEEPAEGEMFDVDTPPEPTYEHHPALMKAAQQTINLAHAIDLRII